MTDGQFLACWFGLGVSLFALGLALSDKNRDLADGLGGVGGFIIATAAFLPLFFR